MSDEPSVVLLHLGHKAVHDSSSLFSAQSPGIGRCNFPQRAFSASYDSASVSGVGGVNAFIGGGFKR